MSVHDFTNPTWGNKVIVMEMTSTGKTLTILGFSKRAVTNGDCISLIEKSGDENPDKIAVFKLRDVDYNEDDTSKDSFVAKARFYCYDEELVEKLDKVPA